MGDHIATASTVIDASPDEVWAVLVDPERIPEYMLGSHVETTWAVGSPITWSGEWEGKAFEDKGTVLEFEPGALLSTTHFSPSTGKEDVPENYHTVTYALAPEGSGTRVTLTQDNNDSIEAMQHSEQNWRTVVEALKKAVEG